MTTENEPIIIPMDPSTQRFYQGVAAATEVLDAHADTEFPDERTRRDLFFFYAGALAAGEYECSTQEDFSNFLLGLATRAPQPNPLDERILSVVNEWTDEEFTLALGFTRQSEED